MNKLDTSIVDVGFNNVQNYETIFSKQDIEVIKKALSSGKRNLMYSNDKDEYYKFDYDNGEIKCSKLMTFHLDKNGENIPFELYENSDGTRRCLHLFPAFHNIVEDGSDCCYFIDELDRSLHINLVKQLLASFLNTQNQDTRSQLILTNHDIKQMDQDVLRRDEIWIAERNAEDSATSLLSIDEFVIKDAKIRKDRNLLKLYMDVLEAFPIYLLTQIYLIMRKKFLKMASEGKNSMKC